MVDFPGLPSTTVGSSLQVNVELRTAKICQCGAGSDPETRRLALGMGFKVDVGSLVRAILQDADLASVQLSLFGALGGLENSHPSGESEEFEGLKHGDSRYQGWQGLKHGGTEACMDKTALRWDLGKGNHLVDINIESEPESDGEWLGELRFNVEFHLPLTAIIVRLGQQLHARSYAQSVAPDH